MARPRVIRSSWSMVHRVPRRSYWAWGTTPGAVVAGTAEVTEVAVGVRPVVVVTPVAPGPDRSRQARPPVNRPRRQGCHASRLSYWAAAADKLCRPRFTGYE